MEFAILLTSQAQVFLSVFFHLMILGDCLLKPRAVCFLDHLVTVTLSSTCTSLTSSFEKWLAISSIAEAEAEEGEEGFSLGEEEVLPSVLIWVATSFLKIEEESIDAASLLPSNLSSA